MRLTSPAVDDDRDDVRHRGVVVENPSQRRPPRSDLLRTGRPPAGAGDDVHAQVWAVQAQGGAQPSPPHPSDGGRGRLGRVRTVKAFRASTAAASASTRAGSSGLTSPAVAAATRSRVARLNRRAALLTDASVVLRHQDADALRLLPSGPPHQIPRRSGRPHVSRTGNRFGCATGHPTRTVRARELPRRPWTTSPLSPASPAATNRHALRVRNRNLTSPS